MENRDALIDGLKQGMEMERRTADLYRQAERQTLARTDEQSKELAAIYHSLHLLHHNRLGVLDARREALQKEAGEGWLGELLESAGEAIERVLGGMAEDFIEGMTKPSLDTLERLESQLVAYYEKLQPIADPATKGLLQTLIAESTASINRLAAHNI